MPLTYRAARAALITNRGLKISNDAIYAFHAAYLKWSRLIAEEATEIAISYNRHTVLERDVELAIVRVTKRESI